MKLKAVIEVEIGDPNYGIQFLRDDKVETWNALSDSEKMLMLDSLDCFKSFFTDLLTKKQENGRD